jgi:hypothetical protein
MKFKVFPVLTLILSMFIFGNYCLALDSAKTRPSYFDLGVKTGSFLPSRIPGVTNLLPLFGIKIAHSVSPTLSLEYDIDMANAKGVRYYNGYFSLRNDFLIGDTIPLFFLIGVDAHYFKRADSYTNITNQLDEEFSYRLMSGWHMGVGGETQIYGDIYFRADVKMGFSPGRQLTVAVSGIYRF